MFESDRWVAEIAGAVSHSPREELMAYVRGAAHDGTLNRRHGTLRIAQADRDRLEVLRTLFSRWGRRSWIYREGRRYVTRHEDR